IDTAAAGQGLAVASRFLVEEDLRSRWLVQAFAATMRGGLASYVITIRKPRQPKPTESVRRWLLAQRGA
ncbi:LysR family transcriptional regulator, partial [Hyphomicrobiales bacterium BP6-180914]|nr:LysR family transcriptional regulator [Lichenifustis flavocetrariae]